MNTSLPVNEALKPLSWIIGKWVGVDGVGEYPTIKSFKYCEEIEFVSLGQPLLNFTARSWHAEKKNPMHLESGFLRIKPGSKQVSFMVSHNFGMSYSTFNLLLCHDGALVVGAVCSKGTPRLFDDAKTYLPISNTIEIKKSVMDSHKERIFINEIEIQWTWTLNSQGKVRAGVSEVEEGELEDNKLILESKNILRMSFAKDPAVTQIRREYSLDGDLLTQTLSMATTKTPLIKHLSITYWRKQ